MHFKVYILGETRPWKHRFELFRVSYRVDDEAEKFVGLREEEHARQVPVFKPNQTEPV